VLPVFWPVSQFVSYSSVEFSSLVGSSSDVVATGTPCLSADACRV